MKMFMKPRRRSAPIVAGLVEVKLWQGLTRKDTAGHHG